MNHKHIHTLTMIAGVLAFAAAQPSGVFASEKAGAKVVNLFDGEDLRGWQGLRDAHEWRVAKNVTVGKKDKKSFDVEPGEGVMVNGDKGHTSNLLTDYEHGDCYLHIEFTVPHGSNSGVYFQGLYKIQVLDSYGKKEPEFSDCGGIYARHKDGKSYEGHPPRVNASRPPGQWQTFDAVFRAPRFDENGKKTENDRFIAVIHNGIVVHEDVELTGNTRASLDRPEAARGPLMLQGDRGPVAYRNIRMAPLELE